jgi:hypothetical protein
LLWARIDARRRDRFDANINYTKVTRPFRPLALRPVAAMHWKAVCCTHDGIMRMESNHADYSSIRNTIRAA